jgi:ApbE superfamily uncharacterized protein (UPF0280 family)
MSWGGATSARLPGHRLHLQHGPIDLVIGAFGAAGEVEAAYAQAEARFADVLATLVAELPTLKRPVGEVYPLLQGPVARRMAAAVWPHRDVFITPMAAVAGAVADEVLAALVAGRRLAKAYVNNGGDIAVHLAPGESLSAGLIADADRPAIDAVADLRAERPARGIATSGWRGRSMSLGIADAATAIARDAAAADAAATMIANAVDVAHPAVMRKPASHLREDTDLGERLVTVEVGTLPPEAVEAALDAGARRADDLARRGLIEAAALALQGRFRTVGALALEGRRTARSWT